MLHLPRAPIVGLLVAAAGLLGPSTTHAQLFSQRDLVTNPGAGFGGADASAAQVGPGFDAVNTSSLVRVADDFTVSGGTWQVSGFNFFGYSSDLVALGLVSPYDYAAWRLWDRRPDMAGAIVMGGDINANVFTGVTFTGSFRTTTSALTSGSRPIDRISASANLLLDPGQYWLEWELRRGTSVGSVPYITQSGVLETGDALRFDVGAGGGWAELLEAGNAQGMPFEVLGTVNAAAVPEPGTFALLLLTLPLLLVRKRRRAA